MWQNLIKQILVFALIAPLLGGCWDRLEIEDRAVVLAIGIDEVKPGEEKESTNATHILKPDPSTHRGLIRITVQIAVPGRIPLGTEGGGGSPSKQKPVWVLTSVGHTVDDSLLNLQQQLSHRLFYGHLRVIVLSEALAKKGIENESDFFRRQPQVRRTVWMVVSKGNAMDIMKATPQLERVPTLYLLATLEHAREMGKLPNIFMGVFLSASSAKGQEGMVPYLELKKESNIEIAGMAYFKNDKMVGTTTAMQIGQYMVVKEINPGGYSVLQQIPGSETNAIFQTTNRKSKITTTIKNGKLHTIIKCQVEGNIKEKSNEKVLITKENMKELEEKMGQAGEASIPAFIQQTQRDGSDIFGFGEHVRAKHPAYWNKQIKTKEAWENMYKEMTVEVKMQVKIRRIGTKTN